MDKSSKKGIKYTGTIKTQKVCKPWTNTGKGNQVHCHNQTQKVCKPLTNQVKRVSSTQSQSRPKRYVNHGQIY